MFHVSLVLLTPCIPQGLNFMHSESDVRGGFQERNPRKRRWCAVFKFKSSALKVETPPFSETLVCTYKSTRRCNPEG
jgi:hypothetical protein